LKRGLTAKYSECAKHFIIFGAFTVFPGLLIEAILGAIQG
jgi:hypothetical protein